MPLKRIDIFHFLSHRWIKLKKRFYGIIEHQVVQIKEKPNKIAMGCALGLSVNFFPTLGIGFIFAFILATVFRSNQVTATAVSLLTGPLIPLKYALNLLIGGTILHARGTGGESIVEIVKDQYALIFTLGTFQEQLFNFLEFFGSTFIVGAIINAVFFGALFYFGVDFLLKKRFGHHT